MAKISTIGLLTSGGDAPGMNAAIRAVTRAAIYNGWKVKGIYRGWEGLINNEIKDFTSESVSGTINRGGTILRTARSKGFMNEEGRAKMLQTLHNANLDPDEKVNAIRAIYDELSIDKECQEAIEAFYNKAKENLEQTSLSAEAKGYLWSFAQTLLNRQK
jgi:hypothetical protein